MDIHSKVDLAHKLINEVYDDIVSGNIPNTKQNEQVRGLIGTFGKDHFLKNIELMQKWVKSLEIEDATINSESSKPTILEVVSSTVFSSLIHKGYKDLLCHLGTLSVNDSIIYGEREVPKFQESKELFDVIVEKGPFFIYKRGKIQKINVISDDLEQELLDKMVGVFSQVISMEHQCTMSISGDYLLKEESTHKRKEFNRQDMERLFFMLFSDGDYLYENETDIKIVFEDKTARVEFDKGNITSRVRVLVK